MSGQDGLKAALEALEAEPAGVVRDIAEGDALYDPANAERYFEGARSALAHVRLALLSARRDAPRAILDFGSGYGRVLRMLGPAFPEARLAAADPDRAAVDFCARTFGATTVDWSTPQPEVDPAGRYDLIWSASCFTDADEARWTRHLTLLASLLTPAGVLVFTTRAEPAWVAERIARNPHLRLIGYHEAAEADDVVSCARIDELAHGVPMFPRDVS